MQQFAGYEVAPGKEVAVTGAESTIFHLSIVALPHSATNAQATLYATVEGKTFAVASLNSKAKLNQVAVDLIFPKAQSPVFTVKGNSPVHLTGYSQEMEDDMMGEDDEDDFESASDDEEELPITKATKKEAVQKKAAPVAAPVAEEEEGEEESEGDEEDDEEGDLEDLTSEELKQLAEEMEEDEEQDDEEEEGEEESEGDEEDDEEGDLEDLTSEELKQLAEEMEEDDEEEEGEEEEESEEEEEEMPPVSKGRRPEAGKPSAKFAGKPAQNNNAGRQGGKKAARN